MREYDRARRLDSAGRLPADWPSPHRLIVTGVGGSYNYEFLEVIQASYMTFIRLPFGLGVPWLRFG
ncbi:MAG: hypothetical protein AMS18_10915 [Gemmatimonas sp. SG8_17]|nr:MAG: hypothetical protein AMS18_10915 [Gemmatimonas sp. SG8_17]